MTRARPSALGESISYALILWVAAAVSAGSFVVYCLTAARDLVLGDSAELVAVASTMGVAHPPGYPLYTLLSGLAVRLPGGSPFFRASLLSALFGAASAGVVTLLTWEVAATRVVAPARRLASGGSRALDAGPRENSAAGAVAAVLGAATAGIAFGMAPTVWSQSTLPEVYSLSSLLVFGALLLLVRWRRLSDENLLVGGIGRERLLWVGGLVLGLSFAHHLTAVLAVPSVVVALSAGRGRHATTRSAGRLLLFVAAALTIYAYLPIRSAFSPAILWARVDSLRGLLSHISGAQYASRLFAEPMPGVIAKLGSFLRGLPSELSWPVVSLSCVGLALLWCRSKRLFAVLVLELVLVVGHAVNYRIPDVQSYYMPAVAVLSICAGLAVSWLPRLSFSARTLASSARLLPPAVVAAALAAGALVSVGLHAADGWGARDLSEVTGGRAYLRRLLEEIPSGGLVLAQNDRTVFPLWYARYVEGARPDLAVLNTRERAPHLERWYPDVSFPTESELVDFSGGDPSVPCDPLLREAMPLSRYLPLIVSKNAGERPVLADIDIARDSFALQSVIRGLLVEIPGEQPRRHLTHFAGCPAIDDLLEHIASVVGPAGGAASGRDAGATVAYATTLADLGQLLLVRGNSREGIRVLEIARELEPDAPHVRNNLSVAYRSVGRLGDAFEEIAEALRLAPGRASTYHNLSKLYLAAGDEDAAVKALARASRFQPENVRYRIELASLYEKRGEIDEAERALRWVERNAGDDLPARLAYGDFLLRQQRYTEAVAAYRRANESSPLSAGVFTSLSRCYWEMDDADAAVAAMRRSVELQPHNPRLKYDLALMLHRSGKPEDALAHLDDVVRLLPNAWQPVVLKASVLTDLGSHEEALRYFEAARDLGAEGEQFRSAWSKLLLATGDTSAAGRMLTDGP